MRMKRAFIVVNPAAGGGRTRRMWSRLRETLTRLDVEICEVETTGMGTGTELTRLALREGWPLVVAVGGDGTANEVVNGVMDSSGLAKAVVGIIPTGRGRDICRNLGIALDPDMAARRAIEGDEVVVDVGWAESQHGDRRYFINAAA
jgi:diacylglycerol kinase (ATP)